MTAVLLHASCVALKGQGILLVGPSGVGKSDVALRMIDDGAMLVADDQTEISLGKKGLVARPPATLAGLIEIRNMGLLKVPFLASAPVALYVELFEQEHVLERLPESAFYSLLEHPVRWLKLPGKAASTPAKIRMALQGCFYDPS